MSEIRDLAIVIAEDIDGIDQRLSTVEGTVEKIKMANSSIGTGAPSGSAPVGWYYTDVTTGDVYKMEA